MTLRAGMIRTNSLLTLLEKSNIPMSHDTFLTYLCRPPGKVCSYSLFVFTMVSRVVPKNTLCRLLLKPSFHWESHSSWLTSLSLSPFPEVTNHNSISCRESDILSIMFKLQSWLLEVPSTSNPSKTSLPWFWFVVLCGREPESNYRNGWVQPMEV